MRKFLKDSVKHTVIFGMGDMARKIVGFFLLPVYMARLTPADYGVLTMLGVISMLSINIISQGIPTACLRFYSTEYPRGEEGDHYVVYSTALIYMILTSGAYYGLLIFLAPTLNGLFFKEGNFTDFIILVFITAFFEVTSNISFVVLRARVLSAVMSVVSLIRVFVGTLLIIWFVVFMDMKVKGILIANVIMGVIVFLGAPLIPLIIHKKPPLKISSHRLREMVAFGLPFVPGAIAMWVLTSTDRFFLEHFSTRTELGLYSLGASFAYILVVAFLWPFRKAWPGLMLPKSMEPDAKETFGRVTTYFLLFGSVMGLAIIMGSKYVIRIMGPLEYWGAYSVVPILVLSTLIGTNGLQDMFNTGIFIEKKTKYAPMIIGIGAITNVIFNLILVPRFGMMGASFGTLSSAFIMAVVTLPINQRIYPIPYEYRRMAHLGSLFILMIFLNYLANPESLLLAIPVKIGLFFLFIGLLFTTRFFTNTEILAIKETFFKYAGIILSKFSYKFQS